jgi:hypothetical protein
MASQRVSQRRAWSVDDLFEQDFVGIRCVYVWIDADGVLSPRRAEE